MKRVFPPSEKRSTSLGLTMTAEAAVTFDNGHSGCLLCGGLNPGSWALSFQERADGGVETQFTADRRMQGYENILHGGVIAGLMDAAMGHCLFHRRIQAVTGDFRVRFLHPVFCNQVLDLRAWLVISCPPLYQLRAEIHGPGQGLLLARAEAKFMRRGLP